MPRLHRVQPLQGRADLVQRDRLDGAERASLRRGSSCAADAVDAHDERISRLSRPEVRILHQVIGF
jgi:hypothetical protein